MRILTLLFIGAGLLLAFPTPALALNEGHIGVAAA